MKQLHTDIMVFCDYAMVSQDNKPSVLGIFTDVGVQQFPGGLARAFLFATVNGEPNTVYEVTLRGDKEKPFDKTQGKKEGVFPPIALQTKTGANGKANMIINLNNLGFPEVGEYTFTMLHKGKEFGSTVLHVFQAQHSHEHVAN